MTKRTSFFKFLSMDWLWSCLANGVRFYNMTYRLNKVQNKYLTYETVSAKMASTPMGLKEEGNNRFHILFHYIGYTTFLIGDSSRFRFLFIFKIWLLHKSTWWQRNLVINFCFEQIIKYCNILHCKWCQMYFLWFDKTHLCHLRQ